MAAQFVGSYVQSASWNIQFPSRHDDAGQGSGSHSPGWFSVAKDLCCSASVRIGAMHSMFPSPLPSVTKTNCKRYGRPGRLKRLERVLPVRQDQLLIATGMTTLDASAAPAKHAAFSARE